ncbi:LysR family transcriptional regulator [Paenibacillus physcomitrellae]|uniref:Transcriptional regulator n=2 Tax=Paenibacillus physcomitrellae TaxID=1619311 RepID=A0ABQ1GLL8_9BACL|nr:LysR family transcriptional regulator [Paenibacillus physcomitrellae]GGA46088.1 transcriptional regulator [Paenibacillus physcomitrellae]
MDIEGLQAFVAVAREKSISKAAQALHTSQPALSLRIRRMEEGLGFPLLARNWNGVRLTPQGYYFLPYAIRLIQDLEDASSVLTNPWGEEVKPQFEEVTGHGDRLLIGMDTWLAPKYTAPILRVLHHSYPGVNVRFVTRPTETILDLIEYRSIHLGIHYHELSRPALRTAPLAEDDTLLLAAPDVERSIDPQLDALPDLTLPFLLFDNPVLLSHRYVTTAMFQRFGISRIRVVDDLNVAAALVAEGLAYTMLPASTYAPSFRSLEPAIVSRSLHGLVPPLPIRAAYVHADDDPFAEIIRCVIEHISVV